VGRIPRDMVRAGLPFISDMNEKCNGPSSLPPRLVIYGSPLPGSTQ